VRFVVSTRLGSVLRWLELYPDLRFKLDPDRDWTDGFVAQLSDAGVVDTVDFKGIYRGDFGMPPDPELYTRIANAFPEAWLEDPALSRDTSRVLEPHRGRITWDAGIHEWSDVEALPFRPRCLNSKPSRFGSVRRLFDFYDACEREGIQLYGGGQFELGAGRAQIQRLASLFHADAPNDVAPSGFNATEPVAGLPVSPLELTPQAGFRG
jgi:O-succinylbenzoate synthase